LGRDIAPQCAEGAAGRPYQPPIRLHSRGIRGLNFGCGGAALCGRRCLPRRCFGESAAGLNFFYFFANFIPEFLEKNDDRINNNQTQTSKYYATSSYNYR
jgi:hypothetical protein